MASRHPHKITKATATSRCHRGSHKVAALQRETYLLRNTSWTIIHHEVLMANPMKYSAAITRAFRAERALKNINFEMQRKRQHLRQQQQQNKKLFARPQKPQGRILYRSNARTIVEAHNLKGDFQGFDEVATYALLDSRATRSFISESLVKRLGILSESTELGLSYGALGGSNVIYRFSEECGAPIAEEHYWLTLYGASIDFDIVYVNDIIFTGNDKKELEEIKKMMAQEFEVRSWNTEIFLGMEIARNKKGISVFQKKYSLDLLKETNILG
ncbi:hypothetical protein ZIOFF_014952 [Zingiber officinale]|uniref:Reverse transcriptase Ty1/copia-type domain-containing protein n=1 Tax=Zingiber officinale TaxID=94328 RepID=A0A8J5LPX3_ZINOF|nr:hypothetical protein ZIOFF_014952 [Zingiber officinale]